MKKVTIVLLITLLSCCGKRSDSPTKIEKDNYIILDVHPPKHYSITVQNLRTGQIFKNVNVSKHCNSWEKTGNKGRNVYLSRYTYEYNGSEVVEFNKRELEECLCK